MINDFVQLMNNSVNIVFFDAHTITLRYYKVQTLGAMHKKIIAPVFYLYPAFRRWAAYCI
jgi:prepilin-type processing-associated H-X9-DG protein